MGMNQGGELNPSLRASDADRERVVEILRQHTGEGRITAEEFDERMAAAYDARTIGALSELTTDLPVDLAEHGRRQAELARKARPHKPLARQLREDISGLAGLGVVLTVVWIISGGGTYWPAWPLCIIAAITVSRMIKAWGHRS